MKNTKKMTQKKVRKLRKRWYLVREFYEKLNCLEPTTENAESIVESIICQWQRIMRRFQSFPNNRFKVIDEMVKGVKNENNPVLIALKVKEISKAFQPCFQ